jgi:hypothetical protein
MLAFVEYAFMNDLADIDRAIEQMVDCASGEYSAAELSAGNRCPYLAADLGVLKAVVEDVTFFVSIYREKIFRTESASS